MLSSFAQFARRRRRELAIAGSLALHVVVIWVLTLPSSSRMAGLDQSHYGELREGVDIDLVSPSNDHQQAPSPAPMNSFQQMIDPSALDNAPPLEAPKPTASLADIFGKSTAALSTPATAPASADAHVTNSGQDNKTADALWRAIEPCWKRIADKNTVAVTLSVNFSPLGNLSNPPVVVLDPYAPFTDHHRRSVTQAIRAISECGPYLMAFGQSDVKVNFPSK